MKLKLQREQTGESWTLKPNREYIIGRSQDCDIVLADRGEVSDRHIRLSFNPAANAWQVDDLGSSNGTYVSDRRISNCALVAPTRIALAGSIFLIATPDGLASVTPPPSLYAPPSQPYSSPSPHRFPTTGGSDRGTPQTIASSLRVLSWREYVEKQIAARHTEGFGRFAAWFHLVTGFRNTPWIRAYGVGEANNFNAFDGYIIPNFKGSAEDVTAKIEEQLSQLKQYEDTDCFVTKLTDAHIADSATQNFLGVELFPIQRDGRHSRADYRRFCVVSYHHVKTYLLVENYGSDLFVSWITRFEPDPTQAVMILWLIVAVILTLLAFATQNAFAILTPLLIWSEVYLITPTIVQGMGILPKKANARLITALLVIPSIFILVALAGAVAASNFF